jgi:hypothetical protein
MRSSPGLRAETSRSENVVHSSYALYMNNAGEAGDAPLAAKWKLAALVKKRAPLVRRSAV